MEHPLTIWIIMTILVGVGLGAGIERLMRRLGVQRVEEDAATGGFRDVVVRVERAAYERRAMKDRLERQEE